MMAGRHHSPRSGQAELLAAFRAEQQRVGVPMAGGPTTCRHGAAYTAPTPVQLPVTTWPPRSQSANEGEEARR